MGWGEGVLGFRVWGLGFIGFRVEGLGCWGLGVGTQIHGPIVSAPCNIVNE